ncbi:Aflatoxin B1 aldehyde reductase member 3 [Apiospora sp. TS-2023a]
MAPAYPQLIFGGAGLGDDYKTLEDVQDILGLARSHGINEVDTAALYPITNMGLSEKLLGEFKAIPKGFAVDTKILVLSKEANGTLEPDKIRTSLDNSRKSLQLDGSYKVNVLHCHAPDYTTPIKDQASTLNELHKQGLFDKLGVCNWPVDMLNNFIEVCEREGYVKPTVYQGNYNLLERGHETLMPTLRKHGIRFDAHSPVAGGMLSGKLTAGDVEGTRFGKDNMVGAFSKMQYDKPELHAAVRYLDELLKPSNIPSIEAALRWISYHSMLGPNDSIILGASKARYLTSNVEAIQKGPLPEDIAAGMAKVWDLASGK